MSVGAALLSVSLVCLGCEDPPTPQGTPKPSVAPSQTPATATPTAPRPTAAAAAPTNPASASAQPAITGSAATSGSAAASASASAAASATASGSSAAGDCPKAGDRIAVLPPSGALEATPGAHYVAYDKGCPQALASDAKHLYWSSSGEVFPGNCSYIAKVPLAGGAAEVVVSSPGRAAGLVVHGEDLLWIARREGNCDEVWRVPSAGGGSSKVAEICDDAGPALQREEQQLYLAQAPRNMDYGSKTKLLQLATDGRKRQILWTGSPTAFAVSAGEVFFGTAVVDPGGGPTKPGVLKRRASDGGMHDIAPLTSALGGVAADATRVFWAADGKLFAKAKTAPLSDAPKVLTSGDFDGIWLRDGSLVARSSKAGKLQRISLSDGLVSDMVTAKRVIGAVHFPAKGGYWIERCKMTVETGIQTMDQPGRIARLP